MLITLSHITPGLLMSKNKLFSSGISPRAYPTIPTHSEHPFSSAGPARSANPTNLAHGPVRSANPTNLTHLPASPLLSTHSMSLEQSLFTARTPICNLSIENNSNPGSITAKVSPSATSRNDLASPPEPSNPLLSRKVFTSATSTKPPSSSGYGRFAPSPTGEFHLGNLRTALLSWALARNSGMGFLIRMEDIDERSRPHFADMQLRALETLGLDWDGPVVHQKERSHIYEDIVNEFQLKGLLYECYCTRKDLAEAPSAPHQPPGSYPGTCRFLPDDERERRRNLLTNRGPALRLATDVASLKIKDLIHGSYRGTVDDLVIRRGDGVFSYNFSSVVDDHLQGVTQIVRGDDLLSSTPRQVHLQSLLGAQTPKYIHVPLVMNHNGVRLAKRDGAVTLTTLQEYGWTPSDVIDLLGTSLGMDHPRTSGEFADLLRGQILDRPPFFLNVASLKDGPAAYLRDRKNFTHAKVGNEAKRSIPERKAD